MSGSRATVEITTLGITTTARFQLIDVTDKVSKWVSSINADNGILVVYSPHTTAGIIINEAEKGLIDDILKLLTELTKPGGPWKHNLIDNNAHAHLTQILVGNSRVIPVFRGELALGTWQRIMLVEMDGPRNRKLTLTYIGT